MRVPHALVLVLAACGPARPEPVTIEVPLAAPVASASAPEASASATRRTAARPPRPPTVEAPSSSAAAAQALFTEGRLLMARGAVPEACLRFDESLQLDPALGTLLNLAACEELAGHVARACELFHDAAQMARASGQPARERLAVDKLARLSCP